MTEQNKNRHERRKAKALARRSARHLVKRMGLKDATNFAKGVRDYSRKLEKENDKT